MTAGGGQQEGRRPSADGGRRWPSALPGGRSVPSLDARTAVLLTVIGFVVSLTGIAFLLVSAWVPGSVVIALGLAAGSVGYRAMG
jgi:hypothetical protein